MKEYKVGDTIYVQGKINQIDKYDTSLPYCVDFENGAVWITRDNIIDELPTAEPVKPVLPKAVGKELDIAKNELQISFDVYIWNIIDSVNSAKDSYHYYIVNTNAIIKLADAWRYGYTVEKEPVSLVYVPGTNKEFIYCKRVRWSKQGANSETPVTPQPIATWRACKDKNESLFEFTDAEITKFGLQDCEKEEVNDDEV